MVLELLPAFLFFYCGSVFDHFNAIFVCVCVCVSFIFAFFAVLCAAEVFGVGYGAAVEKNLPPNLQIQ